LIPESQLWRLNARHGPPADHWKYWKELSLDQGGRQALACGTALARRWVARHCSRRWSGPLRMGRKHPHWWCVELLSLWGSEKFPAGNISSGGYPTMTFSGKPRRHFEIVLGMAGRVASEPPGSLSLGSATSRGAGCWLSRRWIGRLHPHWRRSGLQYFAIWIEFPAGNIWEAVSCTAVGGGQFAPKPAEPAPSPVVVFPASRQNAVDKSPSSPRFYWWPFRCTGRPQEAQSGRIGPKSAFDGIFSGPYLRSNQ